jgi:pterin-4a-carbinolamine dehydratase
MSPMHVVNTLTVEPPGLRRPPIRPELFTNPLKPERVQEMLAAIPAWQILGQGKSLRREKSFPDVMAALTYSAFVSSLASNLHVPVSMRVQATRVVLTMGSTRQGRAPLSEAQLAFALLIS